jgi:lipoprotein-anchoring transpeptidase ErfK/SrfK
MFGGKVRTAVLRLLVAPAIAALAVTGSAHVSVAATSSPVEGIDIADVQPAAGSVVGVGSPVRVTFTEPIVDRAAAERTIDIQASTPMSGHFEWANDNVVQWNPDGFWPAHSHVTVVASGFKREFDTGAAVVAVASISAHTFTVTIDGQTVRTMPASLGKPATPTPVGTYTAMSRESSVIMDSRTIGIPLDSPEGYRLTVNWAVRVTSGGVYVHSAPWSVNSQGVTNVSHGCINLSPENAQWYYNTVQLGDPIIVEA